MLIVGYRTDAGEVRLLLQTWWARKQFVEVDERFYHSRTIEEFVDLYTNATAEQFEQLLSETGIHPITMLQRMLVGHNATLPTLSPIYHLRELPQLLRRYGPMLLPAWRVTPSFQDATLWQHSGPAEYASVAPSHSMLIVGYRKNDAGRLCLLLQNWWRGKQFVEVAVPYLRSCVTFPLALFYTETPQSHISTPLKQSSAPRLLMELG